MKKWIAVLVALAVAGLIVFLARPRPGTEEASHRPKDILFGDVYREACLPVDPATLGKAWAEESDMAALRAEWRTLGAADSTMMERLAQDWIYPESQGPFRLTNVTQTPHGATKTIQDRLKLGETLLKHPTWRLGSTRHYPAAAVVLSSNEKCVLQYLGLDGSEEPQSISALVGRLRLPEADLRTAIENLASVGWLVESGASDSTLYAVPEPAIAHAGGLSFLNYDPAQGRTFDVASFAAVLHREMKEFQEGRVKLYGNCSETGRLVFFDIGVGKFILGRPGQAVAADIGKPGLSNGIFASKRAFESWKSKHPNVTTGEELPVPSYFRAAAERS